MVTTVVVMYMVTTVGVLYMFFLCLNIFILWEESLPQLYFTQTHCSTGEGSPSNKHHEKVKSFCIHMAEN